MKRVASTVVLAGAGAAALLVACTLDNEELPTQDIVFSMPWTVGEESLYSIVDDDGEPLGTGVLKIEADAESRLRLVQEYASPEFSDQMILVTEAQSLKPISVERVISGEEGVLRIEGRYLGGIVEVERTATEDGKEEQRTDRLEVPEHAYDSASSVFLWRTMRLDEEYRAAYNNLATAVVGKPQSIRVTTRVAGRETVEVPAGIFEAWRVEIRSSGVEQTAWYATEGSRPLVKYDNGEVVFLLESVEEGGEG
jgi:hypothetical protein